MSFKSTKSKAAVSLSLIFFINIYSCCVFKTDTPDLRITGQNFPASASVNQTFNLSFTVANISDGECDAEKTNSSLVNLRMINRQSGHVQVNNTATLNQLENNQAQTTPFSVNIGTAGTYDLTFIVDPNNTSGQANRNNDTLRGVVLIQ